MTSFAQRYEERKEQLRKEVINHYNYELSKANNGGKSLQVSDDAASQYLKEDNVEALVTKGTLVASAVVGGIAAVTAAIHAPSQLFSSALFSASATLGMGVLGGLAYHTRLTTKEKVENLSKALFEKEVVNLMDNPRFAKFTDILFEAAENKFDREFLKNTMLFSEEFTEKVAKEKQGFGYLITSNNFVSKSIDNFSNNVSNNVDKFIHKMDRVADQMEEKAAAIRGKTPPKM